MYSFFLVLVTLFCIYKLCVTTGQRKQQSTAANTIERLEQHIPENTTDYKVWLELARQYCELLLNTEDTSECLKYFSRADEAFAKAQALDPGNHKIAMEHGQTLQDLCYNIPEKNQYHYYLKALPLLKRGLEPVKHTAYYYRNMASIFIDLMYIAPNEEKYADSAFQLLLKGLELVTQGPDPEREADELLDFTGDLLVTVAEKDPARGAAFYTQAIATIKKAPTLQNRSDFLENLRIWQRELLELPQTQPAKQNAKQPLIEKQKAPQQEPHNIKKAQEHAELWNSLGSAPSTIKTEHAPARGNTVLTSPDTKASAATSPINTSTSASPTPVATMPETASTPLPASPYAGASLSNQGVPANNELSSPLPGYNNNVQQDASLQAHSLPPTSEFQQPGPSTTWNTKPTTSEFPLHEFEKTKENTPSSLPPATNSQPLLQEGLTQPAYLLQDLPEYAKPKN